VIEVDCPHESGTFDALHVFRECLLACSWYLDDTALMSKCCDLELKLKSLKNAVAK